MYRVYYLSFLLLLQLFTSNNYKDDYYEFIIMTNKNTVILLSLQLWVYQTYVMIHISFLSSIISIALSNLYVINHITYHLILPLCYIFTRIFQCAFCNFRYTFKFRLDLIL